MLVIGRKFTTAALAVALTATMGLAACDRDQDRGESLRANDDAMAEARAGWPEGLGTLIDRGNTQYREGRYDDAAETFREATELAPDVAAGWFGLHMAESARGNEEAADEARMRAEALTPGLGVGHPRGPMGEMPEGELPPGHPTMQQMPEGHP
jgi:tetratricopeptide (TPR) repeat protein